MTVSVHLSGDRSPGGLVSLVVLPVDEIVSASVSVAGVALTPVAPALYRIPPGAAVGTSIVATANGASRTLAVAARVPTTWVIPLATQSNMVNAGLTDAGTPWPAGVSFLSQVFRPFEPGASIATANGGAGAFIIAKHFAVAHLAAYPDDEIIFVPGAYSGTGFASDHWNPGDSLYENLVELTNGILFANPDLKLRCVLVQGFERDAALEMPALSFRDALDAFVAGLRSDISHGSDALPIVFGELPADFVASTAERIAIRDEALDAPDRLAHTAIASSRTPSVLDTHDGTHLTAAAAAAMGARHYAALAVADANAIA